MRINVVICVHVCVCLLCVLEKGIEVGYSRMRGGGRERERERWKILLKLHRIFTNSPQAHN